MNQEKTESRSFAIHTLGCKVNTYESDVISEQMRAAGFTERNFQDKADIYIINTCTVTNIADRKSRQMLHRAGKENPEALIIAAGCYVDAVIQGKGLPDPEVDLWIGNRDKSRLAEICLEFLENREKSQEKSQEEPPAAFLEAAGMFSENHPGGSSRQAEREGEKRRYDSRCFLTRLDGHTRAFVKIEDGCNMYCTYCVIPYVRGAVVSRPVEDTLREITALSENGVKEVVLTGIHLSSMGKKLLETMKAVNAVPGIARIRLGSLEPRFITADMVGEMKKLDKFCPHFHLSLQSGSNAVLKRMKRRYTAEEFLKCCQLIRKAWPDAAVTTDIIVGFPGETEEEFAETLAFAKEAAFFEPHVFKFSRRKGTLADRMPSQLTEAVKAERSRELIGLGNKLSHDYRSRFVGKEQEFLGEETVALEGKPYITGYTREYVRCALPEEGRVWSPGDLLTGTAVSLRPDKNAGELLILE